MGLLTKLAVLVVVGAVAYNLFYKESIPPAPKSVEGYFHPHFREVAEVFRQNVESGREPGASFAVYHQGEVLIDLRGGWSDAEAERTWKDDTLTIVYSVTKGIGAIVAAKMVEKGWLDYSKPVSHYWPEFQKDNVTVGMLLSHQAGLVYLDTPVSLHDLMTNRPKVEEILAKQKPAWPPGTGFGYHTITFGLFVDTLLQKAHPKKKNISEIFQEEIGIPFDIEFYLGQPRSLHHRSARLQLFGGLQAMLRVMASSVDRPMFLKFFDQSSLLSKSTKAFFPAQPMIFNDPDNRAFGMSSMLGFSSAKHLAKLYGILANGGSHKGKQLLKKATIDKLLTAVMEGEDKVLGIPTKRSYGLFVDSPRKGSVGHAGYGGQMAYMDKERKLGMAYVTNFLGSQLFDPRFFDLEETTLRLLATYKGK